MLIETKVKVSYLINGKTKKRTETYLLDREFFSEAEYAVTHLLEADMEVHGGDVVDFSILSLKQSSIKEIDEQTWDNDLQSYIATFRDIFTEDDGTEKQLRYKLLLWAENLTAANQRAVELAAQGYNMLIEGIKQVDYIYYSSVDNIPQAEESNE